MEEFIDKAVGVTSSLVGEVTGGQGSSVGEVIVGRGHSWSGDLSRTTLEGSGSALPPAVGRGRPLSVAATGLGSARAETPPGPQRSR